MLNRGYVWEEGGAAFSLMDIIKKYRFKMFYIASKSLLLNIKAGNLGRRPVSAPKRLTVQILLSD